MLSIIFKNIVIKLCFLSYIFFQEFTSARYVRLRLQKIRTLNADLMSFMHAKMKDIDPTVTTRVRLFPRYSLNTGKDKSN